MSDFLAFQCCPTLGFRNVSWVVGNGLNRLLIEHRAQMQWYFRCAWGRKKGTIWSRRFLEAGRAQEKGWHCWLKKVELVDAGGTARKGSQMSWEAGRVSQWEGFTWWLWAGGSRKRDCWLLWTMCVRAYSVFSSPQWPHLSYHETVIQGWLHTNCVKPRFSKANFVEDHILGFPFLFPQWKFYFVKCVLCSIKILL